MKTKDQIYSNLYQKAKKDRTTYQATIEFFVAFIISIIVSYLLVRFSPFYDLLAFAIAPVLCSGYYIPFVIQRGVSVIGVSNRRIMQEMRNMVDRELSDAKKSNFSCQEQIKKLEQIKKEIVC